MTMRTDHNLAILSCGALLLAAVAAIGRVWDAAGAGLAVAVLLAWWSRRRCN